MSKQENGIYCRAEILNFQECGWESKCQELGFCYIGSKQMEKDIEKAEACGSCERSSCYHCVYNENEMEGQY